MNNYLISIIIPIFNSEKFIEETLKSIVAQTYTHWECILIDDGSTDNTVSIIKNYITTDNRFCFYNRPESLPKGANSCRNFGFDLSKGQFVNWFDSDDVMLETFLQDKIREVTDGVNLVITSGFFTNETLETKKQIDLFLTTALFHDYVSWKLKVLTPSVLFRKSFLEGKELFSYKIKKGQEAEFFSRIFFNLAQTDYVIVNKHTYLYRSHENSSTTQNQVYKKEFKESEAYTLIENLKRAQLLNNKDLVRSRYRLLVNMLFKAIQNNHNENVEYVMKGLKQHLYKKNKIVISLLQIMVGLHQFINFTFIRWDKAFKKMLIQ